MDRCELQLLEVLAEFHTVSKFFGDSSIILASKGDAVRDKALLI